MMTVDELAQSADEDSAPPAGISPVLRSLWFARAGQWEAAHDICQSISGVAGAWIHAWLHREEGDLGNAAYWYAAAGKPVPSEGKPLSEEWLEIAAELIEE